MGKSDVWLWFKKQSSKKKNEKNRKVILESVEAAPWPSSFCLEFGERSNETRQVWNEKYIAARSFSLRILSGQLIPAGEFDEVSLNTSICSADMLMS